MTWDIGLRSITHKVKGFNQSCKI